MKAHASPAHHGHGLLAALGGFLLGVFEWLSVAVLVVVTVTVLLGLVVDDAHEAGFIVGYYGGAVLLGLVLIVLAGGILYAVLLASGAERITRPRPPQREAQRVDAPSHWERFLYYFGLKRDPRRLPR